MYPSFANTKIMARIPFFLVACYLISILVLVSVKAREALQRMEVPIGYASFQLILFIRDVFLKPKFPIRVCCVCICTRIHPHTIEYAHKVHARLRKVICCVSGIMQLWHTERGFYASSRCFKKENIPS